MLNVCHMLTASVIAVAVWLHYVNIMEVKDTVLIVYSSDTH